MSGLVLGPTLIAERAERLCGELLRTRRRATMNAVLRLFGRAALMLTTVLLLALAGSNTAQAQADISITTAISDPTPNVGQTITYTVTVTNLGPLLSGVIVTAPPPAGLSLVGASPSLGVYNGAGTGQWTVGGLGPGETATLTAQLEVTGSSAATLTASLLFSTEDDPNSANDTSSVTVTPQRADLSVTNVASNATPTVGSTITYTLTLTNNGPNSATGVSVTDLLPAALVFVTATPSAGTYNPTTGLWNAGNLAAGSTQTLQLSAVATSLSPLANTATVSRSDQFDPNLANNTATANTTPAAVPPSISQAFGASTIPLNSTTSLTFTITNPNASIALTGVGFSDTLPAGLVVATPNGLTGSCGAGTISAVAGSGSITLAGGSIPANSTCSVSINVMGTVAGAKSNTTSAVTSTESGNGSTSTASLTVNSPQTPTLSQAFGAPSITVNTTTSLTFTIVNPNTATPLTGVAFTDTLPAGLVVATPSGVTGACGAGAISAAAGGSSISLSGGSVPASGTCSFTVNVTGTTAGAKTNTISALVANETGTGGTATATLTVTPAASTTTTLASSANPSSVGQVVTFTASVSSGAGTPTGTVTFKDGSAVLGTAALSAGVATFTAASLSQGTHTITASYGGGASFVASTSAALMQVVNIPADSLKLRAMQLLAAPVAAQVSGQAISGAVGSAVSEGFSDGGGAFMTPSAGGIRFNFAADPDEKPADAKASPGDPFNSASGAIASATRREPGQAPSRVDDAFGALGYAAPTKAPPRRVEPKDWLGWAEVRGAILDRWTTSTLGAPAAAPMLYGNQINALAGLTRKLLPNFLVGVVGGYETFDYRSDALQGRLKGDGWTVGSYLGWMITANMRFDAAVAYSGIGYDGSAGTAAGTFGGHRLLVSGGLSGTYQAYGLQIEPSARVYALWEREDAYTDTLGTAQAERTFSTGRASGGLKVAYPIAWSPTAEIAPYVGVYGDYYFNTDDGTAVATAVAALPAAIVLDGWSARAVGGITARFGNGAQVALGGERSGLGSGFALWTYRARASVPFAAQ